MVTFHKSEENLSKIITIAKKENLPVVKQVLKDIPHPVILMEEHGYNGDLSLYLAQRSKGQLVRVEIDGLDNLALIEAKNQLKQDLNELRNPPKRGQITNFNDMVCGSTMMVPMAIGSSCSW